MDGFRTRTALAACGLFVLTVLAASSVEASTLTVVNNFDSGLGSLRQAILDANIAGTNATGTAASSATTANGTGLFLLSGSSNNTVGGAANAARNLISGNSGAAISMRHSGTLNHVNHHNYIGTNAAGTNALP